MHGTINLQCVHLLQLIIMFPMFFFAFFSCCNAVTAGGSLSQFVVDAQPNFATKTMINRLVLEGLLYFADHMTSQCRVAGLYSFPDRHSSERTLNCRCGLKCNAGDGNFKMSKLHKSLA